MDKQEETPKGLMETVMVKDMLEADRVVREMKLKDYYLAAQSNAGLDEGWRLTFLPSSAFTKEFSKDVS